MSNTVKLLPRPIHPNWKCIYYKRAVTTNRIYIHDTNTDKVLVTITVGHNVVYQEYHQSYSDIYVDKKYMKFHSLWEGGVLLVKWIGTYYGWYELTKHFCYVSSDSEYITPPNYNLFSANPKIDSILKELVNVVAPVEYNVIREHFNTEDIKEAFTKLPSNLKEYIATTIRQAKELRVAV